MTDQNMTMLTVDGFSTMRRIIRNMLRQLGYTNVVEAEEGAEAWSLLQRKKLEAAGKEMNDDSRDAVGEEGKCFLAVCLTESDRRHVLTPKPQAPQLPGRPGA
jgi:CheY-like chemotaxis protein